MNSRTLKKTTFNWPIVSLLLFLCAVPGLPTPYFIVQLLMGPPIDGTTHSFVAMHYFAMPVAIIVHGIAGFSFFITIPFQFSPAIRAKNMRWHKRSGKVAILSAYVLAVSGFWVIQFVSVDPSIAKYTGFVATSLGMIVFFTLALQAIRSRNIPKHRIWMIRGVAIPLGGVTPILLSMPFIAAFGHLDNIYPGLAQFEADYSRWLGMAINLTIVEIYLLREKKKTTRRALKAAKKRMSTSTHHTSTTNIAGEA